MLFQKPSLLSLFVLTKNNYSYWRTQVLASVRAHVFGHIMLCDRDDVPSPDNDDWHRKDQFLLSWLPSSVTESMLGYVNLCEHSCDVWKILRISSDLNPKLESCILSFNFKR